MRPDSCAGGLGTRADSCAGGLGMRPDSCAGGLGMRLALTYSKHIKSSTSLIFPVLFKLQVGKFYMYLTFLSNNNYLFH